MISREDVDIEVAPREDPGNPAVRLTHKETGLQAESREHATQVANFDAALAELEQRVAEHLANPSS